MDIKLIKNYFLFKILGYYLIFTGIIGFLTIVISFISQLERIGIGNLLILIIFVFISALTLIVGTRIKDFKFQYLNYAIGLQLIQIFAIYLSPFVYEFSSFFGVYLEINLNNFNTVLTFTLSRLRLSFSNADNLMSIAINIVPFIILFLISKIDKEINLKSL